MRKLIIGCLVVGGLGSLSFIGACIAFGMWTSVRSEVRKAEREARASVLKVSREDFGEAWPLSVNEGVLECRASGEVLFTAGTTTYAVNGLAQRGNRYPGIEPIWLPSPEVPGARKDIGPLIDRGLKLCGD